MMNLSSLSLQKNPARNEHVHVNMKRENGTIPSWIFLSFSHLFAQLNLCAFCCRQIGTSWSSVTITFSTFTFFIHHRHIQPCTHLSHVRLNVFVLRKSIYLCMSGRWHTSAEGVAEELKFHAIPTTPHQFNYSFKLNSDRVGKVQRINCSVVELERNSSREFGVLKNILPNDTKNSFWHSEEMKVFNKLFPVSFFIPKSSIHSKRSAIETLKSHWERMKIFWAQKRHYSTK